MTNTPNTKPASSVAHGSKPDETKLTMVTLDQLAAETKMTPRDARMLLRLAAKQTKQFPTLGKEHVARQPWQWTPGSKSLDEARKALSAATAE